MLGVIIGVASVIAMIALGSGARAAIDEQIQSQGTNVIYLSVRAASAAARARVRGRAGHDTDPDPGGRAGDRAEVPTVARLTPVVRGRAQVVAGNQNWNTPDRGRQRGLPRDPQLADRGRARTSPPARSCSPTRSACWAPTVAQHALPRQDPVGQVIRVKNMPFRVLGVLAPKGQGQCGDDQDDFILAPYTTRPEEAAGHHPPATRSRSPPRARTSVEPTGGGDHPADARAPPHPRTPTTTTSPCARSRRWRPRACRWPRP